MELKVWVDSVARVVCGLSLDTSCQDVVIALAQSIGQTGRYVLIMKLRGNERQLLADDCPLQHLAQLGQLAGEAQFILQRTGPSLSNSQNTQTTKRQLPVPRPSEPDPLKHQESHKAQNFNQGSSTLPRRTKSNRTRTSSATATPEPRASPISFLDAPNSVKGIPSQVSKEEVFKQVLQQQKKLQDLEIQVQALERETEALERETSSARVPSLSLDLTEELEKLEQRLMQNKEALMLGEQWEELLQAEMDKGQDMHRDLQRIQSAVDNHIDQIKELHASSAQLEHDLQLTAQRQLSQAVSLQSEEALRPLRLELHNRLQQAEALNATMKATQRKQHAAEEILQERWEMIEALNKELRQCDLQQFIQQTGGLHTDQANSPLSTEAYFSNPRMRK
ncbi:ras association domain-containing protein 7-like [Channa argus]|uniref:ras association domain-containing protein 7-like n=1 Tax=Channa argus TaxID=215402 RepID=UPI0029442224|nr:hypothetical protein Q8A73_002665 [Channa argus]